MLELRESHRYGNKASGAVEIAAGDVVMIHSDHEARGFWNMGRVEETGVGTTVA